MKAGSHGEYDAAVSTSYPQDRAIGCQIQVQKVWREHSPGTVHLPNEQTLLIRPARNRQFLQKPKAFGLPMPLRLGALTRKEVCQKPPPARLYGVLIYDMSLSHFFRRNPLAGGATAAMCRISNVF